MRHITIACFAMLMMTACASPEALDRDKILSAQTDFTFDDQSGLYIDKALGVLAINAARTEFRDVFIQSNHIVDWLSEPETFSAELVVFSEIDGESEYKLLINSEQVQSGVAAQTPKEFEMMILDFGTIMLSPGDRISIASTAVTNGKIPEGDGTAYSRGRWKKLLLTKTD